MTADLRPLIDLTGYRLPERMAGGRPDPVVIHVIYAQDNEIYHDGRIVAVDETAYRRCQSAHPNDIVNKFGQVYAAGAPLLLHRRLADVLVDVALDLRDRHGYVTVVMDGLRTYDSGERMEEARPDLVASGLLARAGTSAHNRALAVDSKLFELKDIAPEPFHNSRTALSIPSPFMGEGQGGGEAHQNPIIKRHPLCENALMEVDEGGHLDDLDMTVNSRFYAFPPSSPAARNRLSRLRAWQRASVQRRLPIANLLAEFWDDRVPGSPADMWRVLSCRALCIGRDGDPKTDAAVAACRSGLDALHRQHREDKTSRESFAEAAYGVFSDAWSRFFSADDRQALDHVLGAGGGSPPLLSDFLFHEWLPDIHDRDLEHAGFPAQLLKRTPISPASQPISSTTG